MVLSSAGWPWGNFRLIHLDTEVDLAMSSSVQTFGPRAVKASVLVLEHYGLRPTGESLGYARSCLLSLGA